MENLEKTTGIESATQENVSENYVNWNDMNIRVPTRPYNAGGKSVNYTTEKVLDTLNFYYKMAIEDNLNEALREELTESHPRHLLNEVLKYTLQNELIPKVEFDWFAKTRINAHKNSLRKRKSSRAANKISTILAL